MITLFIMIIIINVLEIINLFQYLSMKLIIYYGIKNEFADNAR